jgi:protein tyrosine/serine phosphatase
MRRMAVAVAVLSVCVACAATNKGQINACSSSLSEAIPNSCVVSQGVLWRGSKPDAAGAASLLSLGVRTVVNLELLHDDMKAFQLAQPSQVISEKLYYFRIHEWEPNVVIAPSVLDSHVAEFLAIVKTQPKPIYVHCRSGENRTGVMVAAYRVLLEGWSPELAVAEMGKYKGIWFKEDAEYINSLRGEHRASLETSIQARLKDIRPTVSLTCSVRGCDEVE